MAWDDLSSTCPVRKTTRCLDAREVVISEMDFGNDALTLGLPGRFSSLGTPSFCSGCMNAGEEELATESAPPPASARAARREKRRAAIHNPNSEQVWLAAVKLESNNNEPDRALSRRATK